MDDVSDAIEAKLTGWSAKANREVRLAFVVQADDHDKVLHLSKMVGHDFGLALGKIDQQPAKEKQAEITAPVTEQPARAFTGYCREAIELCDNLEFQMFLSTDFTKSWSTAKEAVCDLTQVVSRKEIVPGSPSGDRWERLKVRFHKWKSDKNLAREPN